MLLWRHILFFCLNLTGIFFLAGTYTEGNPHIDGENGLKPATPGLLGAIGSTMQTSIRQCRTDTIPKKECTLELGVPMPGDCILEAIGQASIRQCRSDTIPRKE